MVKTSEHALRRVAFVGSSLPRRCGIATFTADLHTALAQKHRSSDFIHVAVTDAAPGYAYGPEVRYEIAEKDVAAYRRVADFLNTNGIQAVSLQHEFGLFGGPAGSHILALLRDLRVPVVTTLHTILRDPDPAQRKVIEGLHEHSDRLVTMSRRGEHFLREVYGIPAEKIDFIPHGIPDVAYIDPNFYKDKFQVDGKIVLLTFGLLSPGKGLGTMIEAMPAILARHPNVVYLVVGATHPHLLRREGESYRVSLEQRAVDLGIEGSVVFHNRFVSSDELVEFLGAADLFISPYPNEAQITSGTLAQALGAGKAVVSTPYWYAQELLSDGCGRLVPFNDAPAMAAAVIHLLEHDADRQAMRKKAYMRGRDMIWQEVAAKYLRSFDQARARHDRLDRPAGVFVTLHERPRELPLMNLDHLRRLTDDTGIFQHATFAVPDFSHGYTTDDNARALILAVLLEEIELEGSAQVRNLADRYLAFLWYAFDTGTARFHNVLSYARTWSDANHSEDAGTRALWALGVVLGRSTNEGLRGPAGILFDRALHSALTTTSPRAWAFSLLGIHEYLRRFTGDRNAQIARDTLANRLSDLYQRVSTPAWPWFEEGLSYDNAVLPHALLVCGETMPDRPDLTAAGLASLDWLIRLQRPDGGHFVPIGSNGFYRRDGARARYDQQPIEAQSTILACQEAHRLTGDARWRREAELTFDWFLGRNDLSLPLYDPATGGCRDGLHQDRINQNQGSESTLAFLLSLVAMRLAEHVIPAADAR